MNSEVLNKKIAELCDREDIRVTGLADQGKCIPYIGWFWRSVDFDHPTIKLASIPTYFVGFCENNKWDYLGWRTTEEQAKVIVKHLEAFVKTPNGILAQQIYNYIQTCKPSWVQEQEARTYKLCRNSEPDPTQDCMECGNSHECRLYNDWVDSFKAMLEKEKGR